ncbi:ABC transporter ATP-binding protein [Caulobacter endophyticus]|uniref:ABC transporter ATP-binding protein n=1 Tax=Caulobacter endophyticus TaxID=2172652 RepID=UPI00240FF49C|nr:ABC transporter ATP-binding protein [Caulobacter endophyticus]MDG2528805.1 ABC transporter ATP-binding protein [Caulobacter endophyticus]
MRSLRKAALNVAVGGVLMRSKQDQVSVRALTQVSLDAFQGDRIALVGSNGAGKSTLLRVLAGIYPPSQGVMNVNGVVNAVFDSSLGLDMNLTGYDNIAVACRYRGIDRATMERLRPDIVEFSGLGGFIHLPMRTYSLGMMARLAFAITTSVAPDILVMDEWLATGDADFMEQAQARLRELVDQARVLVLATHSMPLVRTLCNKVVVLNHGRVAYFGPIEDLPPGIYPALD